MFFGDCDSRIMVITRASQARDGGSIPLCRFPSPGRIFQMFQLSALHFVYFACLAIASPYQQIVLRNNGYSHTQVGALLALGQGASVLITLLFGHLADRTGKARLTAIVALTLMTAFFVPLAFPIAFALAAVFIFLFHGCYGAVEPMITAMSSPVLREKGTSYSSVRVYGTIGYVACGLALSLGGLVDSSDNISILRAFLVTAGASLVCLLAFRTRPRSGKTSVPVPKQKESSDERVDNSVLIPFIIAIFLIKLGNSSITMLLFSFMTEELGLGNMFIFYTSIGSAGEMLLIPLSGYLVRRWRIPPVRLVAFGAVALVLRLLINVCVPSLFLVAQLMHGITFGVMHIGATMFLFSLAPPSKTPGVISLYTAVGNNLPNMIGSLIGGAVIEYLGYNALFLGCAVPVVLGLGVLLAFRNRLGWKKSGFAPES